MANGPPTPPPTTQTEIQDANRTVVPPAEPSSSAPAAPSQTRQDAYQTSFPRIVELASASDFKGLIKYAEYVDITADAERHFTRLLIVAPLVLAYLITDNLAPARIVLDRLPTNLSSHALATALTGLLASAWERKYANVYSRAEALFNMASQPDFIDPTLGTVIGEMAKVYTESFRYRTSVLLSNAYSTLSLSVAQGYLGLPADEVISRATQDGWTYDAASQVLTPARRSSVRTSREPSGFSTLDTFHFVADSVAKLEA